MTVKIIGFGNILMYDDGIGVWVINELKKLSWVQDKNVEIIDGGVGSINLVEEFCNDKNSKIIIVDALTTGEQPGKIYKLSNKEIEQIFGRIGTHKYLSLHEINLATILQDIVKNNSINLTFIGVEIKEVKEAMGLSEPVKQSIPEVINIIKEEVTNFLRGKS